MAGVGLWRNVRRNDYCANQIVSESARVIAVRLELNNPPTAAGGFHGRIQWLVCRLELNNPPTAVGGIPRTDPVARV